MRLHEGDGWVVADDLHVAIVRRAESPCKRGKPVGVPLRRAPDMRRTSAAIAERQTEYGQGHAGQGHRIVDCVETEQARAPRRRISCRRPRRPTAS